MPTATTTIAKQTCIEKDVRLCSRPLSETHYSGLRREGAQSTLEWSAVVRAPVFHCTSVLGFIADRSGVCCPPSSFGTNALCKELVLKIVTTVCALCVVAEGAGTPPRARGGSACAARPH